MNSKEFMVWSLLPNFQQPQMRGWLCAFPDSDTDEHSLKISNMPFSSSSKPQIFSQRS